jgi:hypothetical protein
VLGLALRLDGEDGQPHDLLLARSVLAPGLRLLPLPARWPLQIDYSSLLPYSAAGRPVLLAASPTERLGTPLSSLADELCRRPVVVDLLVAAPLGSWEAFGWFELSPHPDAGGEHLDLRFDPVLNPLPGLPPTVAHATLRLPSYLAARRSTERISAPSTGPMHQSRDGRDSNPRQSIAQSLQR